MDLPILVLILALLLAIAWLIRKRIGSSVSGPKTDLRAKDGTKEFHGVSIILSANPCAAAEELASRRFLATAAPKLPLPGCDTDECTCRFEHHKDRRVGKDRRNPFSPGIIGGGDVAGESEQREHSERRKD